MQLLKCTTALIGGFRVELGDIKFANKDFYETYLVQRGITYASWQHNSAWVSTLL